MESITVYLVQVQNAGSKELSRPVCLLKHRLQEFLSSLPSGSAALVSEIEFFGILTFDDKED